MLTMYISTVNIIDLAQFPSYVILFKTFRVWTKRTCLFTSDNKEKDFVRAEFLPQALPSSYCLLAAIGREIYVFCQLDLSIVKRAL